LSFIKSRLTRLEEHIRGGRCQECGLPPHRPGRIVLFGEAAPRQTLPDAPEERCGSCGGPLWCVLRVVYEDAADSDAA
jgi:NAD-dependent SIR2 family protein deacetylase